MGVVHVAPEMKGGFEKTLSFSLDLLPFKV